MNKQITHLNVHLVDKTANENHELNLFELILSLFEYLVEFTFRQSILFENENENLIISQFSSTTCFSLTKLNIDLNTFEECLFIFDGLFPSLSHCSIYVDQIFSSTSSSIDNRVSHLRYS